MISIWVAFSDRTYWTAARSSNVACRSVNCSPRPLDQRVGAGTVACLPGKRRDPRTLQNPPGPERSHVTPHFTAFFSTFYAKGGGRLGPGERVRAGLSGTPIAPHGLESLGLQPAGR